MLETEACGADDLQHGSMLVSGCWGARRSSAGTHDIKSLFLLAYLVPDAFHVCQACEVAYGCVDVQVGVLAHVPTVLADVLECVCCDVLIWGEDDDPGVRTCESFGYLEPDIVCPARH